MNKFGVLGTLVSASIAVAAPGDCVDSELYSGLASQSVFMDEVSRTWPEAPEYFTNWGMLDGMQPPYIRLSGQRDVVQDWKGVLHFSNYVVNGGNLQLQVYATVAVELAVSVITSEGESTGKIIAIEGLKTKDLSIPLSELGVSTPIQIEGVAVALIQVPKSQYTTVFFDDVRLTCAQSIEEDPENSDEHPAKLLADSYLFIPVNASSAERIESPTTFIPDYAYSIKSNAELEYQRPLSATKIVVSATEHEELIASFLVNPESPKASVDLWSDNLHELSKARLQDSVIANPSEMVQLADFVAADANHQLVPLLIADVDYEAMPCDAVQDSLQSEYLPSCEGLPLERDRYSHVALPVARLNGSKIAFVYDPQFLVTNRTESLPIIEAFISDEWVTMDPSSTTVVEFSQAGINQIRFRLRRGSHVTENFVLVEVQ